MLSFLWLFLDDGEELRLVDFSTELSLSWEEGAFKLFKLRREAEDAEEELELCLLR
jgi:hypothetical protein